MDKPTDTPTSLISEAHRAKAARIAESLIDGLTSALERARTTGAVVDGPVMAGTADAIYKLDLVSRGPVSR